MRAITKTVATCAVCAAIAAAPAARAAETTALDSLPESVVTEVTKSYLTNPHTFDWLPDDAAVFVISNGTGDNTDEVWANNTVGNKRTYLIHYPQSFWPAVPSETSGSGLGKYFGLFAPTYVASTDVGVDNNLAVIDAIREDPDSLNYVWIFVGHSQGAEVAADAYEQGDFGAVQSAAWIISDPRSPWGIKAWAKDDMGYAGEVVTKLLGIDNNGARDPALVTGNKGMTQIIVVGDPVADFQWRWDRPVSSIIVDLSGWMTLHAGPAPWSTTNTELRTPENTAGLDETAYYVSNEGNVAYLIYDAYHPTAILQANMERDLFGYTDEEYVARVQELDPKYQEWYPIEKPTPENAHVGVHDTGSIVPTLNAPATPHTEVTVPAAVATGQESAVMAVPTEDAPAPIYTEPESEDVAPDPEPEVTYDAPEPEVTEAEPESSAVETETSGETSAESGTDSSVSSESSATSSDTSADSTTESDTSSDSDSSSEGE